VIYAFDGFELDEQRLELRRGGAALPANPLIVRLLLSLVRSPGQLVTKDELVEQVWAGRPVADNVITVSMARLRQALGRDANAPSRVVTVYGRGYRFVGEVSTRSAGSTLRPPAPATELTPPFVGRDRALERLRAALTAAVEGRGRLCALLGEAGIGKTRLAEMLEPEVPDGVRVAWGYCRQAGDTPPLWPWLRLLREIVVPNDLPEAELRAALGPLATEVVALLREPSSLLQVLLGDGADARRHHVFDALLAALELAAARGPRLWVLDDLHGADAASIELLSLLLDRVSRLPVLVVATLRSTAGGGPPRPETHLPRVLGHRNCETLRLSRLTADEVTEYLVAVAGKGAHPLGPEVFERSEGNPFFMVELSRRLRDADGAPAAALSLSRTALELLGQRLSGLTDDTREALGAAAVIGRGFELSLLATVTERAPDALIACLDEALAADVIVAAKDSTTAFEFDHELLRDAASNALTPGERRRWHLRVGIALEQRAAAGEDVPPTELAYHFHAALPDGDLRKTVDYCRRAAAAAAVASGNADVLRYTRRALQALDLMPHPSLRLRGQLLYNAALFARGDGVEFPRAIQKVVRLATEQENGPLLVNAGSMLNPHRGMTALPGAVEALEHALELLPAGDPRAAQSRAIALAGLACAPPRCFVSELCEPMADEAIVVARSSGSAVALRIALDAKVALIGGPARREETRVLVAEVQQIASQHRRLMPVVPITVALREATVALQRGEPQTALASLEQAIAHARELRHGELSWHAERARMLVGAQFGAGTLDVAELSALHRRAEARPIIGTPEYCVFDRLVSVPELAPDADAGVASAAAEHPDSHRALVLDGSEPPSVWSMKVRALAAAGPSSEARTALRIVPPSALASLPCDTGYLGTLAHLARAALLLGELEHAEALFPLLARHPGCFAVQQSFLCEGAVPQLLGMLALALGRHEEALAQLEAAVTMNEAAGLVVRAAEAHAALVAARAAARPTRR
jgi:DNA-binding winged helix-turn-helix (wHTH) protein